MTLFHSHICRRVFFKTPFSSPLSFSLIHHFHSPRPGYDLHFSLFLPRSASLTLCSSLTLTLNHCLNPFTSLMSLPLHPYLTKLLSRQCLFHFSSPSIFFPPSSPSVPGEEQIAAPFQLWSSVCQDHNDKFPESSYNQRMNLPLLRLHLI